MSVTQSSIKSEEKSLGSILADKRPLRVPTYQSNRSDKLGLCPRAFSSSASARMG